MNRTEESLIEFSNSGHVKLALLSEGIAITSKSIFDSQLFAENQFPYGYSSESVKEFKKIPVGLVLPDDVYAGLHLRKNSLWEIVIRNKKFYLKYKDKIVFPINFIPRPKFYGKKLSNGQFCEKVVELYSKYILSFFVRGWCYYFFINKQCKFCSLNPTRKSLGKKNVLFIKPEVAAETAKIVFKNYKKIKYINYASGTHRDNDLGLKEQIELVKTLKRIIPKKIKHHMLTMPPNNLNLLYDLKKAGLDTINFAIEVYNKKKFKEICPGKSYLYNRRKFFMAFKKAVKIFGKGNSYGNFVGGLESLGSMKEGFQYLASLGTAPSINVFHPDPQSKYWMKKPPSVEYLYKMVKEQVKIYRKNKFKPIFPFGGTRNSLDTEVYRGFFD